MRLILLMGACLFAVSGRAAPGLTEAEAVQRGLGQPDIHTLLEARRDAAAGRAAAAGRWANPEIEYSNEALDFDNGTAEERYLWLTQRFNIAGVHGLEREAAASERLAENARVDLKRREIAAEMRRQYYAAVAAEREANAMARWRDRLAELASAVANRARAGDVSRFDALRLEKELALVSGEALDSRAEAESAADRLFSLIGSEPAPLVSGLLPPAADTVDVSAVFAAHPGLQALEAEARAASFSAEAADRRSWPELTLGVGRREFEDPDISADGQLLSLGVEVPLFDNGSGEARAESARFRRLRAERALLETRLAADTRAVLRELRARRGAALAARSAASGASLVAIAETAYEAGEISVLELIDAHRTELSTQREAVRRARAARQSYIKLQLMKGEL
ncbi:TolC family protein [Microbulbifer yueqingensis]|uniref:Outer membrane protein TolC n=1 Tax=Microbulbifer yueqingensis TaxID=658219 RepID=A0A1G8UBQ7_9GAMM|nr:TolC family protein [Microbulbifer yueqingensis]SDJ51162.1 Outer membrane protein TolC [Microbulbifer yueqingensis]